MERRIITTEVTAEDERIETTLRPQCLRDYVGQEKIKSTLNIYIEAARPGGSPWTMYCFTARRVWAKPRWPASLPMRWEPI